MQKLCLKLLIVITVVSSHTVSSQCPTTCFCLAGYVTCSDLKSIPTAFPADTRSLSLTNIDVDEIPAGVFDKLPQIESIEIYLGKIGKISSDAFSSLSDMDFITLNELTIGMIESHAFSNITNIGTISIYMSKIDTILRHAFSDLFALDEIKLFRLYVKNIDSFAMTNIDELFHFYFYTNDIGTMQPYAFSNFANVHKLSFFLNTFGHLGCGSIDSLVSDTYEQSFYSNSVNCSCDLLRIVSDVRLKKHMFSNWCQVPDMDEKVYWEDISSDTLQCDLKAIYDCPPATTFELSETTNSEQSTLTLQTVTKQVSSTKIPSDTKFISKSTISSFFEHDATVLQTDKTNIIATTKALKSSISSEPTSSVPEPTSSVSDRNSYVSDPPTTGFVSVSSASGPVSSVSESASSATWPTSSASESTSSVSNSPSSAQSSRLAPTVTLSLDTTKETPVSESASSATWPTSSASESTSSVSNSPSSAQSSRLAPTVTLSFDTTKETPVSESASSATWPTSSASESTSSVSNSPKSAQPSRLAPTVKLSLDTTKKTPVSAGPLSEKITTRQTKTKFWTVIYPRSGKTEETRLTDFLLISTEKVQHRTKPKVVISDETDVIKAVSSSPKRLQPQSVSHSDAASLFGDSTKLCSVVSLLFLTLVVKIL